MRCLLVVIVIVSCVAEEYRLKIVDLNTTSAINWNHSRIIGGTPTTIEKYPFAVQLQYFSGTVCGGSLITQRHVLTAAHCFYDQSGNLVSISRFSVRVGATYIQRGGVVVGISALVIHEQYSTRTNDNDIAVLLLASAVSLNNRVNIASVPAAGRELNDNTTVWHIGWGYTVVGGSMSNVLNEVEVRTISRAVCAQRYTITVNSQPVSLITDNMLCSGILDEGGKDACQGDSGGPLVYNGNVVVGVTSWGIECGHAQYPGVNMRVSAYTHWINQTIFSLQLYNNNYYNNYNSSPTMGSGNILLLFLSTVIHYVILNLI